MPLDALPPVPSPVPLWKRITHLVTHSTRLVQSGSTGAAGVIGGARARKCRNDKCSPASCSAQNPHAADLGARCRRDKDTDSMPLRMAVPEGVEPPTFGLGN